jgi:hypothetical protein
MGRGFDENDDEYVELLSEYEQYIRRTPGAYEDFDEWLEVEYGGSRKKVIKRKSTSPKKYKKDE